MNHLLRPRICPSFSPSCMLSEQEAWRPRVSAPATYRLGTPRLRSRIWDFGFLSTIDDIELSNSDIAICSQVQRNFSASFQSAFRNRRPGGTHIFAVWRQQFMKYPGWRFFQLTCFVDIINKFTEMVLQNGSDLELSMEQGAKRVRIF